MSIGKPKKQTWSRLVTAYQGGQKNRNGERLRFFFTMFSTSVGWVICIVIEFVVAKCIHGCQVSTAT